VRVLLINQAFYPDVAATAQYASDLAAKLAGQGHDVTVLSSRRGYVDPSLTFPRAEKWRGVRILRAPSTGFGKGGKWRRAFDFATFFASSALRLAFLSRTDVVVALTSPPLVSVLGAFYSRINGSRFLYWVMDLNPDEAVAAGWLRESSIACRVLDTLLRFSLRQAEDVVALDRFMAERLVGKGVPASKLSVIPLWPQDDSVVFDAYAAAEFRRAHALEGKFVVMYAGNHSPCHPLTTLLEAPLLLRDHPDVAFAFVGGGTEFIRVQRFKEKHRLVNVHCVPYQPMSELSGVLSAADLHAVVMGDPFVGIVHPSKVYNIIRVGAPFLYIGPPASSVADLNPAASFRHGEAQEVARFIAGAASIGPRRQLGKQGAISRSEALQRLISAIGEGSRRESEQLVRS
jgi:hypothetical protein